ACAQSRRAFRASAHRLFQRTDLTRQGSSHASLCNLPQESLAYLSCEPGPILMCLEQAYHCLVNGFGFLAQIMRSQTNERRGPVERLGYAGDFPQVLLGHTRPHASDFKRKRRIDTW